MKRELKDFVPRNDVKRCTTSFKTDPDEKGTESIVIGPLSAAITAVSRLIPMKRELKVS